MKVDGQVSSKYMLFTRGLTAWQTESLYRETTGQHDIIDPSKQAVAIMKLINERINCFTAPTSPQRTIHKPDVVGITCDRAVNFPASSERYWPLSVDKLPCAW